MSTERVGGILNEVRTLETWLALWAVRDNTAELETTPAAARAAGSEAVATIGRMLEALRQLRSELVAEIRQSDDEAAKRWTDTGTIGYDQDQP